LAYSRRSFKVEQRRLVANYDVRLAKTMEGIDFNRPVPALWAEFEALGRVPLMVIRGENSDILSEETVTAMRARRAAMETVTVPGQGHAPVLAGAELIGRVTGFAASCDAARTAATPAVAAG
jgi:pimeloyl-ACP methyl ester carboxylesterase